MYWALLILGWLLYEQLLERIITILFMLITTCAEAFEVFTRLWAHISEQLKNYPPS